MRPARFAAAALLFPATLAAQVPALSDPPARPIALDEAVRLAQRNQPSAVQARGQMRTARAAERSAYASFLPSLSLTAGGTRQLPAEPGRSRIDNNGQVITLPSEPWSFSSGLSASMTLFQGGRRFFDMQTAKADLDAAEANDVARRFDIALAVKQQFAGVLASRELEGAAHAALQQAELQLRAASARVAAGSATKSDSLRAVIQHRNAQLALLNARNALRIANASLTRLVGAPAMVTADHGEAREPLTVAIDSADLFRLAENGPAVRQGEANLAAARAVQRAARTPYLPTVGLSYSRGGSGLDNRFGFGDDAWTYAGALRFSVSYPIFDRLAREEGLVRADVSREIAEAALRDARLLAQQSLVAALGQLRTSEQQIEIQQASVAAAEEDLRVQQQRYAVGASTQLDVLTSQTQLTEAVAALIRARQDYRIAHAVIEALIGRELR